MQFTKQLGF